VDVHLLVAEPVRERRVLRDVAAMAANPKPARTTRYRAREADVRPAQFVASSVLSKSSDAVGNAADPQSVSVEADPAVNVSVVGLVNAITAKARQSAVKAYATILATRIADPSADETRRGR
jgi:hypothetical protein